MEQTYYQPQHVAEKEHVASVGAPPQAMGYPPSQQQFVPGNSYNNVAQGYPTHTAAYAHASPSAPTSSGVKRSTCVALLVITVILLAAVIGLGAGLGVSRRDLHNTQAALAKATGSQSAAATATSATASASASTSTSPTSSSSSANATPDLSSINCPDHNNTLYESSTDSKQFRQYCGIDYNDSESQSVGSVNVTSMDACMDACATQSNCTGAGWGYLADGDTGTAHICWMKANLTTSHPATQDWAFAVLLNGSDSGSEKRGLTWGLRGGA